MKGKSDQRVFLTGVTGGVGRHLAKYLLSRGVEVYGLQREMPRNSIPSVLANRYIQIGDLLDSDSLYNALQEVRPAYIYHLAGAIDRDVNEGRINYETNVIGTIKLFNAVKAVGLTPKILLVSSSAVYGQSSNLPIKEEEPLCPLTHYAVSKVAQEMVAIQYCLTQALPIIRARSFNVIGPDLAPSLLCSEVARQIASAEQSGETSIRIGNVKPQRDYTDVRDLVRAYDLLMQEGKPGEVYNVCSMKSHSVKECLDILISKARVPITVAVDRSRYRADEIDIQVGNSSKLNKLVGWQPQISFEESLDDLLNSWRAKVQGECQ
jgi:GDP-4-dehydro-6-deoxy-D-mannose reductase